MKKFFAAVLALVTLADVAEASGPVRRWFQSHRHPVAAQSCPCPNCPAAVATAPAAPKALPAVLPVSPPVRQFVPSVNPQTVRYEYRQVCDGGRCRLVLVPVP